MKAKEIVKRIKENLTVASVHDAFATEVSADIMRFSAVLKARNIHTLSVQSITAQATLRLLKEFNAKWDVVIASLSEDPAFCIEGDLTRPWFERADFAEFFLSVMDKQNSKADQQAVVSLLYEVAPMTKSRFDLAKEAEKERHMEETRKMLFKQMFGTL